MNNLLFLAVEGWIIFLTGVHEEAEENELLDILADYVKTTKFPFSYSFINCIFINRDPLETFNYL